MVTVNIVGSDALSAPPSVIDGLCRAIAALSERGDREGALVVVGHLESVLRGALTIESSPARASRGG
jgi:hypothetical protein